MKLHPGPEHKMIISGLPGLFLVAFVIFATSTLFVAKEFVTLMGRLSALGLASAIALHFLFRRKDRQDRISLMEHRNDLLTDLQVKEKFEKNRK